MPEELDTKNLLEISSVPQELKIENIDVLFDSTDLFVNEFQEPLLEVKRTREEIGGQLREILSCNEHLRYKDFNLMMQGILSSQEEKEHQIKNLLNSYLAEQKETFKSLKAIFNTIKESLIQGEPVKIKDSQKIISQVLSRQEQRKNEVSLKLKEFQEEQRLMTQRLLELLAKGKDLRIKDLKRMVNECSTLQQKRLAQQQERKKGLKERKEKVKQMLSEFRNRRPSFKKLK